MKKELLLITALILVGGCASNAPMTAVESVQGAQDRVDKTNEYVVRAEKTIDDFEKKLQDLMKDATASDKMRGKGKFNEALTTMDRKMAESRRDLAQLKLSNEESWDAYKEQLNSAKDEMHNTLKEPQE